MKRDFLFTVVSALSLVSCGVKEGNTDVETVALTGVSVSVDSTFMGCFCPIEIGDIFISKNIASDDHFYLAAYDGESLAGRMSFLHKGSGPDEFIDASLGSCGDTLLMAMNWGGSTPISLSLFDIDELRQGRSNCLKRYDFEERKGFRGGNGSFVALSDSTILINSGGFDSGAVFSILNLNNSEMTELDWRPDDGVTASPMVKQGPYVDNSFMAKNGNDIFYKCGNGAYAFIFTVEDGKLNQKKV